MTIGSLFSGIGGLELGLEWAGLGPTLWQVEKSAFCRRVLARHWPEVERFDDIQTVGASVLQPVDLICGGFPCQDVSAAGKGDGLAGARSGLWREFARIVAEMRPRSIVVENVASGARRWLPHVRRDLHVLGYRTRAYALSAADVGAPHLRKRVFVVAEADGQHGDAGGRGDGSTRRSESHNGNALVANAYGLRQLQPKRGERQERRWPSHGGEQGGAWATSAGVRRVAHGLPGRVERLRALGNAVVPQCAEVIGLIVAEASR